MIAIGMGKFTKFDWDFPEKNLSKTSGWHEVATCVLPQNVPKNVCFPNLCPMKNQKPTEEEKPCQHWPNSF